MFEQFTLVKRGITMGRDKAMSCCNDFALFPKTKCSDKQTFSR